jgi:pimeloyl-ACP methyl ester carboxylesterase
MRRWRVAALLVVGAACSRPPAPAEADLRAVAAIDATPTAGRWPVGSEYRALAGERVLLLGPNVTRSSDAVPLAEPLPRAYLVALERRFGRTAAASLARARGPLQPGIVPPPGPLPWLIFAPGAGLGARDYRLLLADLASHGTWVIALAPLGSRDASAAAGQDMAARFARIATAARQDAQLGPRMDPAGPLLVGHSLGGAAAVAALAEVREARGAIDIDGDFLPGLARRAPARPILYITGDERGDDVAVRQRRSADWRQVSAGNAGARRLALARMRHFDVADAAALPAALIPQRNRNTRFGPDGGDRIRHRIVAEIRRVWPVTVS